VPRLRADRELREQLFHDFLIGVTGFFRDPEAFEVLERHVIPEIVERSEPDRPIRGWIAGCASGEEAYSLAILLDEALTAANRPRNVKLFATDVHRFSLEVAAAGWYPATALQHVGAERRQRCFLP